MNTPYAARRDRLRQLMRARGLDALLVSHAANRFYLSGFELHDVQLNESAGRLVICADGRDWLCTDARYKDAAAVSGTRTASSSTARMRPRRSASSCGVAAAAWAWRRRS